MFVHSGIAWQTIVFKFSSMLCHVPRSTPAAATGRHQLRCHVVQAAPDAAKGLYSNMESCALY